MAQTEDVEVLQKRLQVSEEWNMRLQFQIQELLRLPRSELETLRGRMRNPDIAIPLLQCYDAAILEKQEENERLLVETSRLRTQLDTAAVELQDARVAQHEAEVRLQEAHNMQLQQQQELTEQMHEAERSATRIQHELSRSLDSEATLRRDVERLQQKLTELQQENTQLQKDNVALQGEALQASRRLKSTATEAEATEQAGELQRVQLELLSKENADKLQELERLRLRMVQALRLASDNHTAHMRAVEERHRVAMEGLRQQAATQEAEILKLRAQLARVDASSPYRSNNNSHLRSTAELLGEQTRQALEVEVKRLYGEVSAMQMQRDDAMLRYEQLSNSLRREESDRTCAVQRETQMLQQKLHDKEQQFEQLDVEYNRTKEEVRLLREKYKSSTTELQGVRQEQDLSLRKVEELRRALATAEETCEQVRRKAKEDFAGERRRVEELEQRVEDVARDMQSSKDRAHAATLAAERQYEELRHQLTATQERLKAAQTRLSTREREVEALTANVQHLQEAVRLNQQQALACDERLQQLLRQDGEKSQKLREMTLLVERLKMEGARAARARDRLLEDMTEKAEPHCSITAKQWDTVAVWSWDVRMETCAICKSTIADLCIECRGAIELGQRGGNNSKTSSSGGGGGRTGDPSAGLVSCTAEQGRQQQQDPYGVPHISGGESSGGVTGDCILLWGVCNHVFHSHCLTRWVQQRPVCPICGREWEVYKITRNN